MKKTSLLAAVVLAGALTAQAGVYTFTATLTGAQEVPPNASTASGVVTGFYDDASGMFNLGGVFAGLSTPATAAHVHAGAPGVNGGVVIPLTLFPGSSTSGSVFGGSIAPLSVGQVNGLFAENWYVNIHNSTFPGGEIRGQLLLTAVPEPETYAAMAGVALVGFGVWRRTRR